MKARPSKLDPFSPQLAEWDAEKLPLGDMLARLAQQGCKVSAGRLSEFLSHSRDSVMRERILGQIASGRRHCEAVEKQLGQNPAPELKTLMELHRVLILQLTTQAGADPALLEVVTGCMKPVMEFAKLGLKEQELKLSQEKFHRETCELFLKWSADQRAREIAAAPATNAEKIDQLGSLMFGEDWKQ